MLKLTAMALRLMTAGESHGPGISVILSGLPAGIPLTREGLLNELSRRRKVSGRSARMRLETDDFQVLGGLRHGKTTGNPLAFLIPNTEADEWRRLLDPFSSHSGGPITTPRPGHADLAGALKYAAVSEKGLCPADIRDVSERASARETVGRVLAGAACRSLLKTLGIDITSFVFQLGSVRLSRARLRRLLESRTLADLPQSAIERSRLRIPDKESASQALEQVRRARRIGTTLGGGFAVLAFGATPGLGSFTQGDTRLDGRLAQAVADIPGIKAVGFGQSLWACSLDGRDYQDSILRQGDTLITATNRDGGLAGGVTNGMPIALWALMKPLPTQQLGLPSVNLRTGASRKAPKSRADVTAVSAAAIVAEAQVAIVLSDAVLDEYGGSHLSVVAERVQRHRNRLANLLANGSGEVRG